MGYADVYKSWQDNPESFWIEQASAIDWVSPPTCALDDTHAPLYRWFTDAEVNTCYNAVDRHVENGRGDQAAIIYDSPITDTKSTITYAELQTRVASLAGALRAKGVEKGDRVIVGVNTYEVDEPAPEIFRPDPAAKQEVLDDLARVRAERDSEAVSGTLRALGEAAKGSTNLMDPMLAAVEAYATVGEVCSVLEQTFGKFNPPEVL